MIIKVLLLTIGLMAMIFILFSIRILLQKNGSFPNLHIGSNKEMKKRGITCVQTMDKMEQKSRRNLFKLMLPDQKR